MWTNIDIDDQLMKRAMRVSGTTTKRETVERGLELIVRLEEQEGPYGPCAGRSIGRAIGQLCVVTANRGDDGGRLFDLGRLFQRAHYRPDRRSRANT